MFDNLKIPESIRASQYLAMRVFQCSRQKGAARRA
jgi:hypothetical protein